MYAVKFSPLIVKMFSVELILKVFRSPQVFLWLDKNATQMFSNNVKFMDVNKLVGSMETGVVFNQLSRVVEKADLLRYEVFLSNCSR